MTPAVTVEHAIGGSLQRFGRSLGGVGFTLGTTEPTDAITGAGIIGGYPDPTAPGKLITADRTIGSGEVLSGVVIRAKVTITGTGRLENFRVEGPATEPTAAASLINTSGATPSPFGIPNVQYGDIVPQKPSAYWTGIGNKNYDVYRVKIVGCIDAFSAFSTTADGLCNIKVRGCYVPNLTHFAPDYANANRTRTHNDAIQMQGNLGTADDILIEGNSFNARHHPTWGTQPTVYSELSCLMVSPNTQNRVSYTSRRNWYRGGVYTVNAGSANPGGAVVHEGDRFEKPGTVTPGPTAALVIDPATARTVTGLTYIDDTTGTAVPVTNG